MVATKSTKRGRYPLIIYKRVASPFTLNKQVSLFFHILALGYYVTASHASNVIIQQNETSGLYSWLVESEGFSLELIQTTPDFIRAIYLKREFPDAEVEDISGYCVFGTVIKNTSKGEMTYDVTEWNYMDKNGNKYPIKTKTEWLKQWRDAGITFKWTLLPENATFYEGDWWQGLMTLNPPDKNRFSLTYKWTIDGTAHTNTLENLHCAEDEPVKN